jgi:pimeloyl-ACP methyl ester carboxylesterase
MAVRCQGLYGLGYVSTTEVPTYFGPATSPLFGVLHLPNDNQIRGGVIICGSLGKEGMDSVRLQRPLADGLARRGFGVLRFDYLGTGDSAFTQDRDDAVDNWRRSIGYALEYLREVGARSITAIGLRAGSLLLSDFLTTSGPVDRVVYLDPVGTGRRYLREQTALAKVAVGSDSPPAGTIPILGTRLSSAAAKEFGALTLSSAPSDEIDHLLILRNGALEAPVQALTTNAGRVHASTIAGLTEFAQIAETLTPLPLPVIDKVIDWIDEAESSIPATTAAPRYETSATMPADDPSEDEPVVESIERIGPNKLFAIRTRPENCSPRQGTVVLFYSTAYDLHIGPMREWVELSRKIAAFGHQALRFDQTGVGYSGPVTRQQWQPAYSKHGVTDAISAAQYAAQDPRDVLAVGICSGSWYAARAARTIGIGSVILVNSIVWNWRLATTFLWQWDVKRSLLKATPSEAQTYGKFESWRKRTIISMKPARKTLQRKVHAATPRFVLMLLWRLGVAHVPEATLGELTRNGTATTVVLSPQDAVLFKDKRGYSGLKRLQRAAHPPTLVTPSAGDHPAYHHTMLAAIRTAVIDSHLNPGCSSGDRTSA